MFVRFKSLAHSWLTVSFWKEQSSSAVEDIDEKLIKDSLWSLSAPGRNGELKGSFLRRHLPRSLENHHSFVSIFFLCVGGSTAQSFLRVIIQYRTPGTFAYTVTYYLKILALCQFKMTLRSEIWLLFRFFHSSDQRMDWKGRKNKALAFI